MTSSGQLAVTWCGNWEEYLLYDGGCGICGKLAELARPLVERKKIGIEKLQEEWVGALVEARFGISKTVLYDDIRLITKQGKLYSGPDVYRHLMKKYAVLFPFYVLSLLPGLRYIFDKTYRMIADNRHRISRTCGINSP